MAPGILYLRIRNPELKGSEEEYVIIVYENK